MRRRQKIDSSYARTVLLTGVLLCLCFSAGEGLRLMPIPSFQTDEIAQPNFRTITASLSISSLYQYATCGLEKSGQKRTQRQQFRGKSLTSCNSGESFTVRAQLTDDLELALYRSLLSFSRPIGRAPPSA
jgi:hypothetical protein